MSNFATVVWFAFAVGLAWLAGLTLGLSRRPRNVIGTRIIFMRDRRESTYGRWN